MNWLLAAQTDKYESKSDEHELGKESESPLIADEVAEVDSTVDQVPPKKSTQCKQRGHIFQKVKRFINKNTNVMPISFVIYPTYSIYVK